VRQLGHEVGHDSRLRIGPRADVETRHLPDPGLRAVRPDHEPRDDGLASLEPQNRLAIGDLQRDGRDGTRTSMRSCTATRAASAAARTPDSTMCASAGTPDSSASNARVAPGRSPNTAMPLHRLDAPLRKGTPGAESVDQGGAAGADRVDAAVQVIGGQRWHAGADEDDIEARLGEGEGGGEPHETGTDDRNISGRGTTVGVSTDFRG
jgi:hypothetical protein